MGWSLSVGKKQKIISASHRGEPYEAYDVFSIRGIVRIIIEAAFRLVLYGFVSIEMCKLSLREDTQSGFNPTETYGVFTARILTYQRQVPDDRFASVKIHNRSVEKPPRSRRVAGR
jgi:hypothetical protein